VEYSKISLTFHLDLVLLEARIKQYGLWQINNRNQKINFAFHLDLVLWEARIKQYGLWWINRNQKINFAIAKV
jgi:hypothetical protein